MHCMHHIISRHVFKKAKQETIPWNYHGVSRSDKQVMAMISIQGGTEVQQELVEKITRKTTGKGFGRATSSMEKR